MQNEPKIRLDEIEKVLVGKGRYGNVVRDGIWAHKNWAKIKLGKFAKGQDRYWTKWEKDKVGKGEKRMDETGNIWTELE